MNSMTVTGVARPFTYDDLQQMPDDGYRRELIDGVLIVSPAPSRPHQRGLKRLLHLLDAACPEELEVLPAPFDIVLADDTVLEPDVLVARRSDLTHKNLPTAPVLAVELLSPSTRRYDLMLKRSRYEADGTASCWVIDPIDPRIIAWDLADGTYVEVANTSEEWTAALPFPVTIDPPALVAD